MDWILNGALLTTIITMTQSAQIPPEMVLAIIAVESGGDSHAARMVPTYPYTMPQAVRPATCSLDTELSLQRMSLGLMQVMGATARSVGYEGWLTGLVDPKTNIEIGIAYLASLMSRYGGQGHDAVIAAYNAGAPRRRPDGTHINQQYVDAVMARMTEYASVVDRPTDKGKADGQPGTEGVTLEDMTKAELLEYAEAHGIDVDSKDRVADLRSAIATHPR